MKRSIGFLGLCAVAGLAVACDAQQTNEPVLNFELRTAPLGEANCFTEVSQTDPVSDISKIRVVVKKRSVSKDGEVSYDKVADVSKNLSGKHTVLVARVPEGSRHRVELFGSGGADKWYAKDPSVKVTASDTSDVSLLLTQWGGFTQLGTPTDYSSSLFPAAVAMGDGKVLITGGFTSVTTEGGGTVLAGPTRSAALLDPYTGEVQQLDPMNEARGAHAMVYLPTSNEVLVVGGASKLKVDQASGLPIAFHTDEGTKLNSVEIFYYDEEAGKWTFREGDLRMNVGRAFPRVTVTADGFALITGGGELIDEQISAYQEVEVFNPGDKDTPSGLMPDVSGFGSYAARAGHTLTFIKTVDNRSSVLVWGGTKPGNEIAEILRQSSRQADGLNGNFAEFESIDVLDADGNALPEEEWPYTFFHTMTRLSGDRFLAVGGVRWDSKNMVWKRPADDEAWLLTYTDEGGGVNPRLTVQQVPGLGLGRVFHSAASDDGQHVAVMGGFADTSPVSADLVKAFDADADAGARWSVPAETSAFLARGGQASVQLETGSILLVGGEPSLDTQSGKANCLYAELYTPSFVWFP